MRKYLVIIFILVFLFSCGQKSKKTTEIKDSIAAVADISKIQNKSFENKNCGYENEVSSLGIGLVIVPSKFDIYSDSLLTVKYASWNMYRDEDKINICSKFFKPDYGIMHFVCIEKTEKAYKVLINYSEFKYLPRTTNYNLKTWEEYIMQSFGIRRLSVDNVSVGSKIRIEPNDKADTLTIPKGHEMFCPMEIKGDWVKVKYDCFYNDENNPNEGEPCHNFIYKCENPLTGWLRWREQKRLLIDIFLMP